MLLVQAVTPTALTIRPAPPTWALSQTTTAQRNRTFPVQAARLLTARLLEHVVVVQRLQSTSGV